MISRFLKKLNNIDYLINSEVMSLFLENSNNIQKTPEITKENSYKELFKKYSSYFTEYANNFDTIEENKNRVNFIKN